MILPFTVIVVVVALAVGVLCIVMGLAKRIPNDPTVLSMAGLELLLVAQAVIAIIGPLAGNPPTGNLVEFWAYGVSTLVIPPLAVLWALKERDRWANVVMGVAALAIAVMLWRMQIIWTVQGS